jgi:aspartate beta-hydroxylase
MSLQISVTRATPFLEGVGYDVCCPFFDDADNLHYILQNSGEIITIDSSGQAERLHCTNGQASGATFDSQGALYVADFAHAAILAVQPYENQQEIVVGVYEDKPLKGPHSIDSFNDSIFFTDSGPLGETGLHSPEGSLFVISSISSGQILKPISLGNLAGPSGIAISPDGKFM